MFSICKQRNGTYFCSVTKLLKKYPHIPSTVMMDFKNAVHDHYMKHFCDKPYLKSTWLVQVFYQDTLCRRLGNVNPFFVFSEQVQLSAPVYFYTVNTAQCSYPWLTNISELFVCKHLGLNFMLDILCDKFDMTGWQSSELLFCHKLQFISLL